MHGDYYKAAVQSLCSQIRPTLSAETLLKHSIRVVKAGQAPSFKHRNHADSSLICLKQAHLQTHVYHHQALQHTILCVLASLDGMQQVCRICNVGECVLNLTLKQAYYCDHLT